MFPGVVATLEDRGEAARQMHPFPLIKFALPLPDRSEHIRQAFKGSKLFVLACLHVFVGLFHVRPLNSTPR
jgi:hypothetical protein